MPLPPAPGLNLRPQTTQPTPSQGLWWTETLGSISSKEILSHFERAVPLNLKADVSRGNGGTVPRCGGECRPSCKVSGTARLFGFPG
jgi:hypothetical protein